MTENFRFSELSNGNEVKELPDVRFEIPIENEHFLKEGLALIGAPKEALDLCTHRVIMTLKKNCNQLSLEESGKLAVMMLNCQLEIEGRMTFPCKPEMVRRRKLEKPQNQIVLVRFSDSATVHHGNE